MSSRRRVAALFAALVAVGAWPASHVLAQQSGPRVVSPAPVPIVPVISSNLPAPASVMWIGAHPDDEMLASPLLARWCGDGRARCSLLTVTRGEAGACRLPSGCLPDLATVRSAEAGASSQLFGAHLILLSLPDGGGVVPPPWDIAHGGSREIVTTIAGFIRAEAPSLVLTFDPRHGTTCHPDHRAIGAIVLEALGILNDTNAPPVAYLLETRLEIDAQPLALHFSAASSDAIRFDANEPLASVGGPAWGAFAADMRRYPSQFDASWLAALSNVAMADRAVFLAPASEILSRSVAICP
jgi:LmbE family N-acetylglucosaminyl deacetylase